MKPFSKSVWISPAACGAVRVADIGLGRPVIPGVVEEARASDGLAKGQGHKYGHGHAMILAGGVGRGGAARLAARGALRIGAGLVTVAPPPSALIENAALLVGVERRSEDVV